MNIFYLLLKYKIYYYNDLLENDSVKSDGKNDFDSSILGSNTGNESNNSNEKYEKLEDSHFSNISINSKENKKIIFMFSEENNDDELIFGNLTKNKNSNKKGMFLNFLIFVKEKISS